MFLVTPLPNKSNFLRKTFEQVLRMSSAAVMIGTLSVKFLSSDINDCDPNPCQNSGLCMDLVEDYECLCEPGYKGKDCEEGKYSYPSSLVLDPFVQKKQCCYLIIGDIFRYPEILLFLNVNYHV